MGAKIKGIFTPKGLIRGYLLPVYGVVVLINYFFLFKNHFHVVEYDSLSAASRAASNISEWGSMRLSGNITRINDPLTRWLLLGGIVVGLLVFIYSSVQRHPAFIALLFIFGCWMPFMSTMSDSAGGGANVLSRVLIGILMIIGSVFAYYYFITRNLELDR
ncbi:hypothetical protein ACFQ4L_03350 [Lapidilactobacillus mulanensis]|uniref:Uncharacterized protein n=1 Tax=Lapidilactobacillus mulanensis TaxID=2485999 RepID=A0ABW4DP50_9LACO|nr:hypothetical protein [Lapidilactobacillus mulanensis]